MEEDPRNYKPQQPGAFFYAGWIAAIVVVFVATAGLVLARELWVSRQTAQLEQEQQLGRRVLVTRVLHVPLIRSVEVPGEIHGYVETPVYAKISGYLKTINVDKGDRVKEGQILAVLESPELDHQVANARADYGIRLLTDERNQKLVHSQVTAQQTADEAHAAALASKATLNQLVAMQRYKIIRAPFNGIVTARHVDPGALIPQNTTPAGATAQPIVSLATLDELRIYAQMPQSAAPFIHDGDPATVTVTEYPGRRFSGSVTRHPTALSGSSRTMLVEVDLSNPDRALYPGMYATVRVEAKVTVRAPIVPDDALVFRDGKAYVPVVRNRRLRLIEATLGYDNGQNVEVSGVSGAIADDDFVALNVGQVARDNEPVQPVERDGLAKGAPDGAPSSLSGRPGH